MNDYKPNSHRFRENSENKEHRVSKVGTGTAKIRKKNDASKLADIFISEDINNVKSYILMDVLVPTIKKAIVDIVSDGISMIFFGGTGARKGRSGSSKISYSSFYESRDERNYSNIRPSTSRFDYEDLDFETRGEAEAILDEMANCIEKYGFVTVADMYDIADVTHPYTSAKYGWTSLATAEVSRCRNGRYIIKLPKARPIEN